MDLVTFYAARLDEDEAYLRSNQRHLWTQRPLREVEAKRRRLERYLEAHGFDLPEGVPYDGRDPWEATRDQDVKDALELEVREDAAVYSDHPDYDETWKP